MKFATDIHIHLAGNDKESGCWFNPKRLKSFGFGMMLKSLKINPGKDSLTEELAARLEGYITTSQSLKYAVVLAYDWAREKDGTPLYALSDFYTSNNYVMDFAEKNENVRAGISIHPYRKDAIEELNRCYERGAVLVKWLPVSQNFSPADDSCDEFYKEMKRLDMPLLCHTGSEGATININKEWNNPRVLEKPLSHGLTVIAAHSAMRSAPHDKDYADNWISMLKDYPDLYGDIAAVFGFRARKFLKIIDKPEVTSRLIHGSDWPVPNSPWWFLGRIKLNEIRRLAKIENPLERDIQTKIALGLDREIFTRAEKILKLKG